MVKPNLFENLTEVYGSTYEGDWKQMIEILPDKFGIMIDGWSEGSEYFFAIFTCFPENGKCWSLLLVFAPPLQEDDLSAKSLQDLIVATLSVLNKTMNNVILFIVLLKTDTYQRLNSQHDFGERPISSQ